LESLEDLGGQEVLVLEGELGGSEEIVLQKNLAKKDLANLGAELE
jgi:hypothetical protein